MNTDDLSKKRTWEQRGSAEDENNKQSTGRIRTDNSLQNSFYEGESDFDTDSVFQKPGVSIMATQGVDILSQLITALQNKTVLKTITDAVSDAVQKSLKAEIHELKVKVSTLEQVMVTKDTKITSLQDELQDLQQYGRRTSLRIFGFPEKKDENTDNIILYLAKKLGVDLNIDHISRSHRVGRDENRPIIVRFISYRKRAELYKARTKLKNTSLLLDPEEDGQEVWYMDAEDEDEDKDDAETPSTNINPDEEEGKKPAPLTYPIHASGTNAGIREVGAFLGSENPKIYINEDLTRQRAGLAAECRKLQKANKLKDTWTYDGNVFVKNNNGRIAKLTNSSDLDKLTNDLSLKMTFNLSQINTSAQY